jgi:plastocyanin
MEQTAFFIVGITLVVVALVVSVIGLRDPGFPGSRTALAGGAAVLVLLVAGATTTAVINAREEQKEHNEEAAAEEAQTETEATKAGESPKELEQQGAAEAQAAGGGGGGGAALELSAPEDGTLAFDTDELEASAGDVTIDFTNPAALEHDVAIGTDGDEIAKSDLVSDGDTTEVSAKLKPGEYFFYCTVPGHREGGMEGTLTVD